MTEIDDIEIEIPHRFKDVVEATLWATKELAPALLKRNEAEMAKELTKLFTGKAPRNADDYAAISHALGLYRRRHWAKLEVQEQRDLNGVRGAYRRGMQAETSPLDEKYTQERIELAIDLVDRHLQKAPSDAPLKEVGTRLKALRDEAKSAWPATQESEQMAGWLAFYAIRELGDRLPEIADALADIPEGIEASRAHLLEDEDSEEGDSLQ